MIDENAISALLEGMNVPPCSARADELCAAIQETIDWFEWRLKITAADLTIEWPADQPNFVFVVGGNTRIPIGP